VRYAGEQVVIVALHHASNGAFHFQVAATVNH
jgi:hypothetical protein